MTPRQLLRQVELPLALPSIVAGIRVAAVIGVGTATIAAAVGAGGLGEYIFRGLSMVDPTVILAGAIPAALLALTFDGAPDAGSSAAAGARSSPAVAPRCGHRAAPCAVAIVAAAAWSPSPHAAGRGRRSASARRTSPSRSSSASCSRRRIERRPVCTVERRLNLGGTFICDRALRSGDIDVYVEYTGTALTAIFHQPVETDPRTRARRHPRSATREAGLTLLAARLREHVRDPRARRRTPRRSV